MDGLSSDQFQGVHLNYIPTVEDLLTLNILLYDIDIVEGNIIGELARRILQKYESTVQLLGYNNHICYVNIINRVWQCFRCPNCDTFFNRTFNFERHLTTCSERVKNIYPKKVYQIQKTLSDKLDSFGNGNTNEQTLSKNLAKFDFESICLQEESFKDTDTTTTIGKHLPISVSISSKLVKEPVFLRNSDPHHLVTSFIGALENLALQSKTRLKNSFFDIETTIKLNWAASRRNLRNVIIEKRKQIWMIAITIVVPLRSFCRSKSNSYLICRSIWNVIAMFYLCLVLTAQNMIST